MVSATVTQHNITSVSPPSTVVLLIFQRGYDHVKQCYKQRILRKSDRSTLGWSKDDEENYMEKLENARTCEAFWISSSKIEKL